ncbi:FMN-dependent NADH-azoreductase [Pelagerythrobacter sp.]|uniref:FMN-dependent NADH-azoreductase n=1 Tax=Pelagerythrobacter sp. TaxID=2800702 RepID=UPI0035ADAC36
MQILRIDSATTGEASVSRVLTQAIVDHLTAQHPEATLVERDLATDPLAHIDPVTTAAIRTPQDMHDETVAAAFPAERAVLDEFLASDVVVIGAPMYNFTIPSQLKAWIDRIAVPGVTFTYKDGGPQGLAGGRRVIVASSRGGAYEDGNPADHQETLLRLVLGFIGIDDPVFIRAEKIGFGPKVRDQAIADAKAEIAQL